MATYTVYYNLALPTVNGDENVWAPLTNQNWVNVDALLFAQQTNFNTQQLQINDLETNKVDEAPVDGQQYARQNSAWSVVVASGGGAPDPHAPSHATGGSDPITPASINAASDVHASTHATGGSDPITPASIGAADASHTHPYLPLAGGTLTGPLILDANPAASLEAATKAYVDNLVALNEALSGVWRWIDNTAMADPGVGNMRGNANTMAACTAFALNKTDNNALTYTFTLLQPGDTLIAGVQGVNTFGRYSVASVVDNGTWAQINVVGSGTATGNPANNALMNMVLVPDAGGATSTGVGEAPNDGQDYWRNSEAWVAGNWTSLDGKPATFPPSAHTHPISDIQSMGDALQTTDALAAGQFVNIYDDAGTGKIRLANAASDRVAHGFVTQAYAAAATATFYGIGQLNNTLAGLTPGATYWLSTTVPGGVQADAPTGSDELVQCLGDALSATAMRFTGDCYVVLP